MSARWFEVESSFGVRNWYADDEQHARDQHLDSFPDDPDEEIISVRPCKPEDNERLNQQL